MPKPVAEPGHQDGQPKLGAAQADQSTEHTDPPAGGQGTVRTLHARARGTMRCMSIRAKAHATGPVTRDQRVRRNILAAQPRTKIWLERDGRFIVGDGRLQLLLAIRDAGSLVGALRRIGWSYRHGWGYLRQTEDVLGAALTRSRPGKGSVRGTELTPVAALLVARLWGLRRRVDGFLGPSGPTAREVTARGRRGRPPRAGSEAGDGSGSGAPV